MLPFQLSPFPTEHRWPLVLLLLLLLAVCVLAPGIQSPTGLTGKDEYALGLRTPLEMMEKDVWLVPELNGQPRLKKPPFLYWLGRASYETFGVSLVSARGIGTLFGALLVVAAAGIGRRLLGDRRAALCGALLVLTSLGLNSEARRFMLDVPTAALSALAFWGLLRWYQDGRWVGMLQAALCLAAGFLVKGPIVALVCGGGVLACLGSGLWSWRELLRRWPACLGGSTLFLLLALPWFVYVRLHYPDAAAAEFQEELEARQLFSLSPESLLGLVQIGLPWSLAALALLPRAWRGGPAARTLALWLAATFIPFLFIRSFDRYLVGSLLSMGLLAGWCWAGAQPLPVWGRRLGTLFAGLFVLIFVLMAWWFRCGGWLPTAAALLWLLWEGWRGASLLRGAAAAALVWMTFYAFLFPAFGINVLPPQVAALAAERPVLMFDGPQPALLPMALGRALGHSSQLSPAFLEQPGLLVFARLEDVPKLTGQADELGRDLREAGRYRVLSSRGSGIRFAREGSGKAEWLAAFAARSLAPLESTVVYFEVQR